VGREAVERLKARIYKHQLRSTGRLPTGKESAVMEKKAEKIGRETDNRRKYGKPR
jgi:hypothetical protein